MNHEQMEQPVNVWLFPVQQQVLVTDQTDGVPVDCCNVPEYYAKRLEDLTGSRSVLYDFDGWHNATNFAEKLFDEKLKPAGWTIEYDSFAGRWAASEFDDDKKIDYCDGDY